MPLSVQCPNCKAKLTLKSEAAAGKKVACPKCKKGFVAGGAKKPADDDDMAFLDDMDVEDDEPEEVSDESEPEEVDDSPRRGKKGKGKGPKKKSTNFMPLILGGGVLLLVLGLFVGGGFLIYNLLQGRGNGIDLAYMPDDPDLVLQIKVADAWGSPFVQQFVTPEVNTALAQFKSESNMEPTDIKSMTFGFAGLANAIPAPGAPVGMMGPNAIPKWRGVIRTTKPIDPSRQRANVETMTHQGKTYYREKLTQISTYNPDRYTEVVGTEDMIKSLIENSSTPKVPDFDFIDSKHHVVIAIRNTLVRKIPSPPGATAGVTTALQQKDKVKAVAVYLNSTDKLDVTVTANCEDEATPAAIAQELGVQVGNAKSELAKTKNNPLAALSNPAMMFMGKGVFDLGEQILNSTVTEAKGTKVTLSFSIPGTIKQTLDPLMKMAFPGGRGSAPGGNAPAGMGPGGPGGMSMPGGAGPGAAP